MGAIVAVRWVVRAGQTQRFAADVSPRGSPAHSRSCTRTTSTATCRNSSSIPSDATSQTGDRRRPYQEYPRHGVIGGFARLATAVERARRSHPEGSVLLVDAGDTFGDGLLANLTRGEATVRMMNALGYSFMTLGNPTSSTPPARTRELQQLAHFPMRAANAIDTATNAPFLGDPTLVVNAGGVRVALLAIGYHNTDQTGNKDNTRGLTFVNGVEARATYVPALRARADVIVVVSHQGTAVDSVLAANVPGIDIIIGGHSHDRIAPPRRVADTWIVQALSDASALGELTVRVADGRVATVSGSVKESVCRRLPAGSTIHANARQYARPIPRHDARRDRCPLPSDLGRNTSRRVPST